MLRRIEIRFGSWWVGPNILVSWEGLQGLSHTKRQRRLSGAQFWFTELGWKRFGRELLRRCLGRYPGQVRVLAQRESGARKRSVLRGDPNQVAIKKGG